VLPIAATAIREQQQQQRKHVAIDVLLLLVVVVATVYFWSAGASDSSGTSFTRFNRQRMETRLYVTLKKKKNMCTKGERRSNEIQKFCRDTENNQNKTLKVEDDPIYQRNDAFDCGEYIINRKYLRRRALCPLMSRSR
jgi:hypothetical protein